MLYNACYLRYPHIALLLSALCCPLFSVRAMGSAALNMCYVAAGRVDGYVALYLHCWDMAAGDLIVREAGGVVTSPDGMYMES